jgi:hypothetical protein
MRQAAADRSSSLVDETTGPSFARAHARPLPHSYKGFGPNFLKGGPPPRHALVASVAAETGKPASVRANAIASRVNNASGSLGIAIYFCSTVLPFVGNGAEVMM